MDGQGEERGARMYPYLSIDHTNQLRKHRHIEASESLDFLNVKFDTRRELREVCLKSFKEKLAPKALFESRHSQLRSEEEELLQGGLMRKKTLNPEQLLRASGERSSKDSVAAQQKRASSHHYKKSIKFLQEIRMNQGSTLPKGRTVSFDREEGRARPKKHLFKMLKKCDQLKEIHRYEAELVSTDSKHEHPIRFYTEPIAFLPPTDSPIPKRKEVRLKLAGRNSPQQSPQKKAEIEPEYKTLDVRKYRGDTSAKQRMKYLLRKQLMKYEMCKLPGKVRREQREEGDREVVGPWEAEQSFCTSKET